MKIKRQAELLSDMIDYTNGATSTITDFTIGSAVRAMYDAYTIEAEELYMISYQNILEGIESGLMNSFDFYPREAQAAYGYVTLNFYSPLGEQLVIPRGTTFRTDQVGNDHIYQTTQSTPIPKGQDSATVQVECTVPGSEGNIVTGGIDQVDTSFYSVASVSNTEDIITGVDAESYNSVKARFKLFIESIGRSTKAALRYAALSNSRISGAYVDESIGTVNLYCHDRNGDLPVDLANEVQTLVDAEYKAAGIQVAVLPIVKRQQDLQIVITPVEGTYSSLTVEFEDALDAYLRNYLNGFSAGQELLLSELIKVIMSFDESIIFDCSLTNITGNISVAPDEILRAGNIRIQYLLS